MKTRDGFRRFGLIFLLVFFALSVGVSNGFSALVSEDEAVAVADLWFAMELNSDYTRIEEPERLERLATLQDRQVLCLVSRNDLLDIPPVEGEVLAYVIKYEPTGFVIVSGEDRIEPIIVFDVKSEFRWDEPGRNFLRHFLGRTMVSRWQNLSKKVAEGVSINVHPNWLYLRSQLKKCVTLEEATHEPPEPAAFVLWDTALWDQCQFYNDTVATNNGYDSCVPTGCTATAMAIKMRFHSWPPSGSGSHSYDDNEGDIQFSHAATFGDERYYWGAMPTTSLTNPNIDVANLMYSCGVAVGMNYEHDCGCGDGPGSGAWPTAYSMNKYFWYKGSTNYWSGHEKPVQKSILGGLPVVLSSSAHTVVACGYRDTQSPYYYLNCGWNGAGNGWYNLNNICGSGPIDYSCPYSSPLNYIYVDGSWAGSENGNIQNPYNTLSEGESAVPGGGHLWIRTGTYTGADNVPITFDGAMTIKSYEGTAVIGDNIWLKTSGRIGIYGSGELRVY